MDSLDIELGGTVTRVSVEAAADIMKAGADADYLLVTDSRIAGLEKVAELVRFRPERAVILPPGEEEKGPDSVFRIVRAAAAAGLSRDSVVVGIGGGVICDMAAFAASIYMRGCRLVLYPTTLLAMVDASIGGKTGADFMGVKNMIGTFYPAERVVVSTDFIGSLPSREYLSGLAEVVKHAFLAGGDLLSTVTERRGSILDRDTGVLEELIAASIRLKAEFVSSDFKENGRRAFLNFGHTFGHALESVSGLGHISHGAAVAWGMARAFEAGVRMGLTDENYARKSVDLLYSYGWDISAGRIDFDTFTEALSSDKKKKAGEIRFVLQHGPGDTFLSPVPQDILREVLGC